MCSIFAFLMLNTNFHIILNLLLAPLDNALLLKQSKLTKNTVKSIYDGFGKADSSAGLYSGISRFRFI